MKKLPFVFYFIVLCLYAVFSFSLTDPNLVLTDWQPYWLFQQWMWQTFFKNAQLLSQTFAFLVSILFVAYFWVLLSLKNRSDIRLNHVLGVVAVFSIPLLLSYNALSHDVFNYIFNAKMALIYHANPHQQVALHFSNDLWLRFMHNTHTPAPYGYGWTVISFIPFLMGFGKFTFTWMLFRLFSLLSIFMLIFGLNRLANADQQQQKSATFFQFLVVLLNPLLLIEVVSNSHNDLWMMAPALISIALLFQSKKYHSKKILLSLILLLFSVSIKFTTVLLLPVWLAIFFEHILFEFRLPRVIRSVTVFVHRHYADISVLLLFLPLLSPRSQQFNSWYLLWLLIWLPFLKWEWLKKALIILSISSLFRYMPWLLAGGFSEQITNEQKVFTWAPFVLYLVWICLKSIFSRNFTHSSVE